MSESQVSMPIVTAPPWRISHQSSTMQSKYFANILKYFKIYVDKKAVNRDKCMTAMIKRDELF